MKDNALQKEIGNRILSLRKKFGYTRETLAEELGISWQHLGNIEKGERGVSFHLLLQLKSIFHVSADYLISGPSETSSNDLERITGLLSEVDPSIYPFVEDAVMVVLKACSYASDRQS